MMSRRMLVFLIVMASLVSTGRPAVIVPEAVVAQEIAVRPWTERLNVGRTQSRISVLQRMTLTAPRRDEPDFTNNASVAINTERIDPLRCAIPPPFADRI